MKYRAVMPLARTHLLAPPGAQQLARRLAVQIHSSPSYGPCLYPATLTVKQRWVHSSLCSEPCRNTLLFVPSTAKLLTSSSLLRAKQAEPSGLGRCDLTCAILP